MKRLVFLIICLTVLSPSAKSVELSVLPRIKEILELFEISKEISDGGNEVADGLDYLYRLTLEPEEGWQELEKRASRFHPQGHVEMPKVDGDDIFSKDAERRNAARERWDKFVDDDSKEIGRLRQRLDQQRKSLASYEKKLEAVSKTKRLFEELSRNPTTPSQYEFAKKSVEFDVLETTLSGIVSDYKRIVREYDALIARKDTAHEAYLRIKTVFDYARNLPAFPPSHELDQPRQEQPKRSQRKDGKSVVEQRIENAVQAGGGATASDAGNELARLRQMHRQMDTRNEGIASRERASGAFGSPSGPGDHGIGSGVSGSGKPGGSGSNANPSGSAQGPSGSMGMPKDDDEDFQVILIPKLRK